MYCKHHFCVKYVCIKLTFYSFDELSNINDKYIKYYDDKYINRVYQIIMISWQRCCMIFLKPGLEGQKDSKNKTMHKIVSMP